MADEKNPGIWSRPFVVDYYESHRRTLKDVYSSEWIFLKDRLCAGMSILDIGCAQGGFAGIIAECLKDFSYTGVDISETMIGKARARFPQHRFGVVKPSGEGIPVGEVFDLVICLGILHLNVSWREVIRNAWKHTGKTLILDLRLSPGKTIEDKNISYFLMDSSVKDAPTSPGNHLPYNILNIAEAFSDVTRLCEGAQKIFQYGYTHPVSEFTISPVKQVLMTTFCVIKNA